MKSKLDFLLAMPVEFNDLVNSEVLVEPMAFVTHPASALTRRTNLTLRDLAGHTLLVPKHDCAYRMRLQQDLMEAHVEPSAVIELNSVSSVLRCLEAGLGVAYLPERAAKDALARRRLTKLRWHEPLETSLYFIRHRDKPLVGAYGAFVAEVEHYFAELRGASAGSSRERAEPRGPSAGSSRERAEPRGPSANGSGKVARATAEMPSARRRRSVIRQG
ncbi:MAG: substrate-binding domain-containing protein [Polyangiaceae bacterium]